MKNKGQSAIEYLMTYGWMLLVVSIAGGAMYSITGSQCTESVSGFAGSDLRVEDYGLSTGNDLSLVFENGASDDIEIKSVSVQGIENSTTTEIDVGSSKEVSVPDFIQSDSCNSLEVNIDYDVGSLQNLTSKGTLTGQYETDSITSPSINTVTQ